MQDLLHFAVDGGPLLVVGLGASLREQVVEPLIVPEGVVPCCSRRIGGGEHPIAGRPAAPIGHAPRLLHPHIVPVAVIGLADDIEVDAAGLGLRLHEKRCIDGTGEGCLGGREVHPQSLHAGPFQMELRLVGIVFVDRLRIGRIFDRRSHRIVIPRGAVTEQDLVDELLSVDRPFECGSHIDIVEGRHRDIHRRDIVAEAGEVGDLEIRVLLQEADRFEIDAIHVLDLARIERVRARRHIDDGEHLDRVEIGLAGLVIVGVALGRDFDARFVALDDERSGADALFPFDAAAILGRIDRQMIVRRDIREIGRSTF